MEMETHKIQVDRQLGLASRTGEVAAGPEPLGGQTAPEGSP